MKTFKWIALASSIVFCAQQTTAQEVVSARDSVSFEEIIQQINTLAGSTKEEDKALLEKEAEALVKKNTEEYLNLAAAIYERALDNEAKAKELNASVLAQFPQGTTVRDKAYSNLVREAGDSISASDFEQLYINWTKQFPATNYSEKDQNAYHAALYSVATRYIKEDNMSKARELLAQLKGTDLFVQAVSTTFNRLSDEDKDYEAFSTLISDAYLVSKESVESEDPQKNKSRNANSYQSITPIYATLLLKQNKFAEAISITEPALQQTEYSGYYALLSTQLLGEAYTKSGEKEKALKNYEQFLIANGKDSTIIAEAQTLYTDIHGTKGNFDAYLADLDKQTTAAYLVKYEKEMIKEEAPAFTLVNREGKEISLSDYKGKVVVLDFWATWCGPCIISFPGMQAAVNKYAADDEVEFLFIDTWQREENYKELVEEFITKNNYSFHVLFDEMKDRSKAAVTAFGIKGIPTKVVIDKAGFIRFQNAGAESNVDKLVKELDTKIELAKRG